jgi:hypothetical protein
MSNDIIVPHGHQGREARQVRQAEVRAATTRIQELLSQRAYEPTELAAVLRNEFDRRTIREAIWRLINETEVDWTPDRILRRKQVA